MTSLLVVPERDSRRDFTGCRRPREACKEGKKCDKVLFGGGDSKSGIGKSWKMMFGFGFLFAARDLTWELCRDEETKWTWMLYEEMT